MSGKISVFLLEDVPTLGKAGDIIAVSEGYARNFLFPQGKAAVANETTQKQQAAKAAQAKATHDQAIIKLQEQAEQLDGTELTLTARVKEGEEIFGSITAAAIAKELSKQSGIALKAKAIELASPITTLGAHKMTVHLSPDVETTIVVTVVPEPGTEAKADAEA